MRKIGYKMVREDYCAFYDGSTKYEVGETIEVENPDSARAGVCGHGLHIGKEAHVPLIYNVKYPWRLLEVSYDEKDVIREDSKKLRVSKLRVERELEPWRIGLPNARRVYGKVKSASKVRLRAQTRARKEKIGRLVEQHVSRLNRAHGKNEVKLTEVRFYTIREWASVWDSVWDSVRASVWDSVRASVWDSVWDSVRASVWDSVWASVWDSVWDSVRASVWDSVWASVRASVEASMVMKDASNPFLPLQRIAETGAAFYGIDKDGVAHVIMPDGSEVRRDEE